MYPKPVQDLVGLRVNSFSGGSNFVFVTADNEEGCVGWGQPVSGKFGFEGGGKSSAQPKYIPEVNPLHPFHVSCGYGHVCVLVQNTPENIINLETNFPKVACRQTSSIGSSSSSGTVVGSGTVTKGKGKKREKKEENDEDDDGKVKSVKKKTK
jgi:hypothetical protein